jgi:hypothetical protein
MGEGRSKFEIIKGQLAWKTWQKQGAPVPFATEGNGVDNSSLFPGCSEKKNHDFSIGKGHLDRIPSIGNAHDAAKRGKQ